MSTDRNSVIHGNQIKDRTVTKFELDATGETSEKVAYVQGNGAVDWRFIRTLSDYKKLQDNVMLNAFRIAINGSLSQFNMIDGIVDEYEDESGIDTINSTNELYDSVDDFYTPTGGLPTSEYTSDTYTKLLLHCNGVDASTSFPDDGDTGHTVTAVGNSQVDTSQKIFGTGSALFDSTVDWLSVPDSDDFFMGTGNFTIDFWVYISAFSPTTQFIFHQETDGLNLYDCFISSSGVITFRVFETSLVVNLQSSASISTGTWYHVAIIRGWAGNANDWVITIDGTQSGSTVTASNAIANYTSILSVGGNPASSSLGLNGWLDEFRVSKDIARWTENFNVFDDMTLISEEFTAEAQPDTGRIVILEEDVDSITLNTDIKVWASRDGGVSYIQGTLSDEGTYDTSKRILVADFDLTQSGIGSGVNMEYKLETLNNKQLNIHASSLNWD